MAEQEPPHQEEPQDSTEAKIDSDLLKGLRGYEYRNNNESNIVIIDFSDPLEIPTSVRISLGKLISKLTGVKDADLLSWRVRQLEVELKPNQIRTFANSDSVTRIFQTKTSNDP